MQIGESYYFLLVGYLFVKQDLCNICLKVCKLKTLFGRFYAIFYTPTTLNTIPLVKSHLGLSGQNIMPMINGISKAIIKPKK